MTAFASFPSYVGLVVPGQGTGKFRLQRALPLLRRLAERAEGHREATFIVWGIPRHAWFLTARTKQTLRRSWSGQRSGWPRPGRSRRPAPLRKNTHGSESSYSGLPFGTPETLVRRRVSSGTTHCILRTLPVAERTRFPGEAAPAPELPEPGPSGHSHVGWCRRGSPLPHTTLASSHQIEFPTPSRPRDFAGKPPFTRRHGPTAAHRSAETTARQSP